MKVLLINGSPHAKGNTAIALNEMVKVFAAEGVESKIVQVGNKVVRGCIACGKCREKARAFLTILLMKPRSFLKRLTAWLSARPFITPLLTARLFHSLTDYFSARLLIRQ